jgi:hypothetical protein
MAAQGGSVTLLHLSDTQFGRNHRFGNLGVTAEDGKFDSLLERLKIDLGGLHNDHGVVYESKESNPGSLAIRRKMRMEFTQSLAESRARDLSRLKVAWLSAATRSSGRV